MMYLPRWTDEDRWNSTPHYYSMITQPRDYRERDRELRRARKHEFRVGDQVWLSDAPHLGSGRVLRIEDKHEWKRNITVVFDNDPFTHYYRTAKDLYLVVC